MSLRSCLELYNIVYFEDWMPEMRTARLWTQVTTYFENIYRLSISVCSPPHYQNIIFVRHTIDIHKACDSAKCTFIINFYRDREEATIQHIPSIFKRSFAARHWEFIYSGFLNATRHWDYWDLFNLIQFPKRYTVFATHHWDWDLLYSVSRTLPCSLLVIEIEICLI